MQNFGTSTGDPVSYQTSSKTVDTTPNYPTVFACPETPIQSKMTEADKVKHEKFREASKKRVQKAANAIRALGKCSGGAYHFTEADIDRMFGYLQQALDDTKGLFEGKTNKADFSW